MQSVREPGGTHLKPVYPPDRQRQVCYATVHRTHTEIRRDSSGVGCSSQWKTCRATQSWGKWIWGRYLTSSRCAAFQPLTRGVCRFLFIFPLSTDSCNCLPFQFYFKDRWPSRAMLFFHDEKDHFRPKSLAMNRIMGPNDQKCVNTWPSTPTRGCWTSHYKSMSH